MQIFLPYTDFKKSVASLDKSRLGNQIYRECLTLIRGGWPNHPASKIWANHKKELARYALAGLEELERRGRFYPHHKETFLDFFSKEPENGLPNIVGNEYFHISHQSNLIRKLPDHYKPIFGYDIPDNLEYVWKT